MGDLVNTGLLGLTAEIVAAYIGHSDVAADALPAMIQSVYRSLAIARVPDAPPSAASPRAVSVKRSVFPNYIVCPEVGKKLKMLVL